MTPGAISRPGHFRLRLAAGLIATMALLVGAWTWSLYGPLSRAVIERQEEYLTGIALADARVIAGTSEPLEDEVKRLTEGTPLRVTVVDSTGVVLADSDDGPAPLDNHGVHPEVRAALDGRTGSDVRGSDTRGAKHMYVAVPVVIDGERIAVRVSTSLARVEEITGQTQRMSVAIPLTLALALSAVAVWRLTYAAPGRVERLAAAAHAMADGDLGATVPAEDSLLAPLSEALARLGEQMRERFSALESEQRTLRVVLDGLSDAVLLLEDDRVVLANRALQSMFRLPPISPPGRTLGEIGIPASVENAIATRLDATNPVSTEVGPDPYRRSHRLLVLPLGATDAGRRTLVVIADVTDRMRLDAVRRDFVANASHELKTPTSGILLLAESADQAARDGDTRQALAFLSQIQAESVRLRQLVADLLDLSRLESVPAADAICDVRRSVELALAGHRRAASAKGLWLETDLDAVTGEDVAVWAESTDVTIALDNLLSNAITYTERGGVTVGLSTDGDIVEISVSDTGIGIPAADVERVFERFYRVDRARSRTSGGTGLGLALVRNVAERSGGSVSITSEPGSGTTVTLRLQRAT